MMGGCSLMYQYGWGMSQNCKCLCNRYLLKLQPIQINEKFPFKKCPVQ